MSDRMDLIAVVGEYTDKNGDAKKRYLKVGSFFNDATKGMSIKLDAVPVDFNGWLSVKEPFQEGERPTRTTPPKKGKPDFDDDVPF